MAHRKLKTPRRKSVTKPTRRYDVSGRAVGSSVATRRTPKPKVTGVTSLQPKRKVGRPSQGKTEVVTSKTGKVYRRTIGGAKPKVKVTPSTVYVAGGRGPKKVPVDPSEVVVKRGSAAVRGTGTKRGGASGALARPGGRGDIRTAAQKSGMGYGESAYKRMPGIRKATALSGGITTGGPVKQSTQAEIKSMQRQMDAERTMNRAKAETSSFERRFEALKRKLRGVQGNPGRGGFGTGKKY